MEIPNTLLGQYDMVLSLSESKINAEMQQLYLDRLLDRDWKILSDLTGTLRRNHRDSDFDDQKRLWLDQSGNNQLIELKAHLDRLGELLEQPNADRETIIAQRIATRAKIAAAEKTTVPGYNLLIEATIDPPKISVIPGRSRELLFSFILNSGQVTYRNNTRQQQYDIRNLVYTFVVPVSKRQIEKEDIQADPKFTAHITEDFTVESILLNFAKADIANYVSIESKMSTDPELNAWLQLVVGNYFRELGKNKDNPYILGYAVQRPELKDIGTAMLEPTGVSYSTSHSEMDRASAFNFLMLTGGKEFPILPQGGRIDKSLIESVHLKDETVNGLIGINFRVFEKTYLARINQTVLDAFCDFVPGLALKSDTNYTAKSFDLHYSDNMKITIARTGIKSDDLKRSLSIQYEISIHASLHDELEALVGTVGVNQKFSTSGKYEVNGQKGKAGKLVVELTAAHYGQIIATVESGGYQPPVLARDTEEPEYNKKGIFDKVWLGMSNMVRRVDELEKMYNTNFTTRISKQLENTAFNELNKFSDRLILPASNVYTFLNVRLLSGELNDSDVVLFDISYVPLSNQ
ncbi:hypothetical protein [uncultured Pedobacter sp.]|uniref:hypothetical protein n=1 Tax=uncultured Pedobacter sp. TaxID=246139 RepID=UPI0025E8E444|nr:hypothetical protein [uncultured Pedobacter sp.]